MTMRPIQRAFNPGARHLRRRLSVISGFLFMAFLTFNTGMAIYRSLGDAFAITFVASAYLNLVALFVCVTLFVRAPPDPNSPRRSWFKAIVWLLTMSLTFQYVYVVMGATAPTLNRALLLWAMPAATGISLFCVFLQVDRFDPPRDEEMFPSGNWDEEMSPV